jgi:hypothetical protein
MGIVAGQTRVSSASASDRRACRFDVRLRLGGCAHIQVEQREREMGRRQVKLTFGGDSQRGVGIGKRLGIGAAGAIAPRQISQHERFTRTPLHRAAERQGFIAGKCSGFPIGCRPD